MRCGTGPTLLLRYSTSAVPGSARTSTVIFSSTFFAHPAAVAPAAAASRSVANRGNFTWLLRVIGLSFRPGSLAFGRRNHNRDGLAGLHRFSAGVACRFEAIPHHGRDGRPVAFGTERRDHVSLPDAAILRDDHTQPDETACVLPRDGGGDLDHGLALGLRGDDGAPDRRGVRAARAGRLFPRARGGGRAGGP